MDSKTIKKLISGWFVKYISTHKTTAIAFSNVVFFGVLTFLFVSKSITADEYAIALAAGTSAITSILGYFTADEK